MDSTAPVSSVDLSYYAAVLRRRWRLVLVGLVIGVGLAGAFLVVQPPRATSWALVNVNPIADNAFSSSRPASDLLVAETEQAMARSTTVVTNVTELFEGDVSASEVRDSMTATLLPDSTVLRIEYTARTPEAAADGARLVSEEYLRYREAVAQERIDAAVAQLDKRRKALDTSMREANKELAAADDDGARSAVESRLQSIRADMTSVNSQINQLQAISTSAGTILAQPDPERATVSPNRVLVLLSGVLGGVLLGVVLPFLRNALDRRLWGAHDVARAGGGAVVATLAEPPATVPATGEDADEVRALRERLLALAPSERPVLTVVDVGRKGQLPSDVATNLAVLVADSGRDTTLLLANYPEEALAQVVATLGLTEGRYAYGARHFHSRLVPSLVVVLPAPTSDRVSPADVVADLLEDPARRRSATVVGVAPGGHSVRLTAARLAHQVVLGVARDATEAGELSAVVTELLAVGAPVHGTVLVHGDRVLSGDLDDLPPGLAVGPHPARHAAAVEEETYSWFDRDDEDDQDDEDDTVDRAAVDREPAADAPAPASIQRTPDVEPLVGTEDEAEDTDRGAEPVTS